MKRFFFDCGTRDSGASLGLLFLRVAIGWMMLHHGIDKIKDFQHMKATWDVVPAIWPVSHLPKPVCFFATLGAEVGASTLIILGLATRPAAFYLGFAMVIAAFQVMANAPFFMDGTPFNKEPAVLYLIPCFVLIITGAGLYSFDNPLSKEKRRRR
jgi:putative oxidoreductase